MEMCKNRWDGWGVGGGQMRETSGTGGIEEQVGGTGGGAVP